MFAAKILRRFSKPNMPIKLGLNPEQPENILVKRPPKGMLWGKGGQYYQNYKVKFDRGIFPPIERFVAFLELE